jgi:hypothetical protein
VIVSQFNRWTKRRGRRNEQTWEFSSQGPPDRTLSLVDTQVRAASEAQDALDAERIAAELKQAQAALDVAHSYPGRSRGRTAR